MHYSVIHAVETWHKALAITFDDGPNPEYTPQIQQIFQEFGGKATFYVIGRNVAQFRDIALSLAEDGHELGNHTYTHPFLTQLEPQQRRSELEAADRIIAEITGGSPATFRPPFFDMNEEVFRTVKEFGYTAIGAVNGEAEDWGLPGVGHILNKTREQIRPGCILIFHDGIGDRSQTMEAVRTLVPELLEQGYELVTVSRLLEISKTEQ
ncbi:polysaccharide deacetylase family protein [Paenibacillus sp. GCM10027628]|uniref:polysaccharide deacetylase family protein n=1 Tax=Paenibacillus sp. GCM10027628 TaxID=3273413 RepID=UPI00362F5C25